MLRTALVPTDMSEDSDLVLRFAAGLASVGLRRVVLAHVADTSGMEGPVIVAHLEKRREALAMRLPVLTDAGLEAEARVLTGEAPDASVVALADEADTDAIVCGSNGKTVMDQLFEGSVSEDIVRRSDEPALVARFRLLHDRDPRALGETFGRQLLFVTDFSDSAERAFHALTSLPKGAVGTLYILHVVDASRHGDRVAEAEREAEDRLKDLVAVAKSRGMSATCLRRTGDPLRVILREAGERRVTGVVAGTRGRGPFRAALLGSVSMALLRQASCPVMIVP